MGQANPHGPQFQVNAYTIDFQLTPQAILDDSGKSVVVWASRGSDGPDSSGSSIQGQRFRAPSQALGGQFQINTYTLSGQYRPNIAADSQGRFVVVWESSGSNGNDDSARSVQLQRFDSDGTPLGEETQVNTYTLYNQHTPDVTMLPSGSFLVVWTSSGSGGSDTSGFSIQGQRFDSSGSRLGSEFQVNSFTTGGQRFPSAATNDPGQFVVAWESSASGGSDDSGYSIQARIFDSDGTPLTDDFQVNSHTVGAQFRPQVALDPAGMGVATWHSSSSAGTDSDGWSVQLRQFDSNGIPFGADFQVNTYTTGYQYAPALRQDATGRFVVAWHSMGSSDTDSSYSSIQVRRFDSTGNPTGDQTQVNTYTTSYQQSTAVASDARGNFLVGWQSLGSYGTDQDGWSIQAQLYDDTFRDGFESGDTSRWSAALP